MTEDSLPPGVIDVTREVEALAHTKRKANGHVGARPIDFSPQPTNGHDKVRFAFTRFKDIHPSPAPAYVVDKIIPRLGIVTVWGKPKCGKTFWTFDLEMHVALGWSYRGHRVEQGEVLHIACEGVAGLGARKEAWRLHHISGKDDAAIEVIDNAPFYLCKDTALDLIDDVNTVVSDIVQQFGDRPIKIITIDTLNRSLSGSESRDEDMAAYIRAATLLAEKFQCAVIVIHHCGHNEDRPRGHSSLIGAVDALIEIKKDADGMVLSEVEEMRDGPSGEPTVNHLEVVEVIYDDNDELITSCVIVGDPEHNASDDRDTSSRKGPSKEPSPAGKKYYDALNDALCSPSATTRPQSAGRASVTQDEWTRELVRLGLVDDDKDKPNRARALISKYRLELLACNWIGFNGGIVWTQKKRGNADQAATYKSKT